MRGERDVPDSIVNNTILLTHSVNDSSIVSN